MSSFEIYGGNRLKGELIPQGAKNEALQVLCAVLLTPEKVTISNIPNIQDINRLIELFKGMGVEVEQINTDTYSFQAEKLDFAYMESNEFVKKANALRGSIMILGPLLGRFHKGAAPSPGGDKIGRRRLDTHFIGLQKLGAKFEYSAQQMQVLTCCLTKPLLPVLQILLWQQ